MQRRLVLLGAVLSCALFLTSAVVAMAIMIRPQAIGDRLVMADLVVVGKVSVLEEKTVSAASFPGDLNKSTYRVAVIKISDVISGAKGLTSVRVGFVPPMAEPVNDGKPVPFRRPPFRRFPQVNLTVGQEGIFILKQHHEKDFYVVPAYTDMVDKKNNNNFDKEVEKFKRCAKLLADPRAGLKSKNAEERLVTAGMLVTKYRTAMGPKPKMEPIDAVESKLILEALESADWTQRDFTQASAPMTFGKLGLTEKDGWKPAPFKNYAVEFPAAARKWLKDNAATYRIQRFVPEKVEKK